MCIWKITQRGDVVYANKTFKDYVGAKEGDVLNVFSDKVYAGCLTAALGCSQGGHKEFTHRLFEGKQGQGGVPDWTPNPKA
jgi:hypothetical protein